MQKISARTAPAYALVAVLALSGCFGSDGQPGEATDGTATPDPNAAPEGPAGPGEQPAKNKTKPAKVYAFNGEITGTSPPAPNGPGVVGNAAPPAKVETFDMPANLTKIVGELKITGNGNCRVEVYGPDSKLVYSSQILLSVGGALEGATGSGQDFESKPPAGSYEVHFLVTGVVGVEFSVGESDGKTKPTPGDNNPSTNVK